MCSLVSAEHPGDVALRPGTGLPRALPSCPLFTPRLPSPPDWKPASPSFPLPLLPGLACRVDWPGHSPWLCPLLCPVSMKEGEVGVSVGEEQEVTKGLEIK